MKTSTFSTFNKEHYTRKYGKPFYAHKKYYKLVNQIEKFRCSVKTWTCLKGAGKFSGIIIKELIDEVDKTKKHATAKNIEKVFEGFDPEIGFLKAEQLLHIIAHGQEVAGSGGGWKGKAWI